MTRRRPTAATSSYGGTAASPGIALNTQASRLNPQTGRARRGTGLCDLCNTAHQITDVALFAARRAGKPGRVGNTVGTYICADLGCSLYLRGLRDLDVPQGETISPERRIDRLADRLDTFVTRVLT